MRHYCSLSDSKYLPQLLALHESLLKHSSEPFMLYILPMDVETYDRLRHLDLENVNILSLGEFEHEMGLIAIRYGRTWQEYCWTCGSNLAQYIMASWSVNARLSIQFPGITYIDADCFFFSDPKVIFHEIGERSIGIIPHRFIPSKKHLESNGQFNVSLVHFKNDPIGRECLSTWAAQCRERCSAKVGCGDQKYLDEWPAKYGDNLCIIQNIGVGLAPWNLANYEVDDVTEGPCVNGRPVVMYHFHEFKIQGHHSFHLSNYFLRSEDVECIYEPYCKAIESAQDIIKGETVHL